MSGQKSARPGARRGGHTLGLRDAAANKPKPKWKPGPARLAQGYGKKETRHCMICKKTFETHPNGHKLTCSPECSEKYHRNLVKKVAAERSVEEKAKKRNRLRDALAIHFDRADTDDRWRNYLAYLDENESYIPGYVEKCNAFCYDEADRILAVIEAQLSHDHSDGKRE